MIRPYKHPRLLQLIKKTKPQTVVEFGSWYGKSATAMALAARHAKIEGFRLYAVDTWLGSIENWKRPGKWGREDLCLDETGRPQFYQRFLDNIRRYSVQDCVIPLSMTTGTASAWLQWKEIKADLVYIDASHQYEDVKADIEYAQDILKLDGILCGDDYQNKEGVTQAVDEQLSGCFSQEKSFWWIEP